jgi:hypothetical protein
MTQRTGRIHRELVLVAHRDMLGCRLGREPGGRERKGDEGQGDRDAS